jgi:micrococcal nuclease
VLDGDTLEVQLASGPINVRMYSIDAPEKNQPWGPEAKAALERRVLNQTVSLQVQTQDRYSRVIADVYVGESLVNAWLVAEGDAWAYRDYLKDVRYCQWEEGARLNRKGLWSVATSEPVAPWLWRKAAREKTQASPGVPPCPTERRKRKSKTS